MEEQDVPRPWGGKEGGLSQGQEDQCHQTTCRERTEEGNIWGRGWGGRTLTTGIISSVAIRSKRRAWGKGLVWALDNPGCCLEGTMERES